MNWTGGRLQRSKANANTIVKTQKQYFGKTRLRLQNGGATPSSLALSISHGQYGYDAETEDDIPINGHHTPRKRYHLQQEPQDERADQLGTHGLRHLGHIPMSEPHPKRRRFNAPLDSADSHLPSTGTGVDRQGHNAAWKAKRSWTSTVGNTCRSAAVKENTLHTVKRNLLNIPDWMGLSAARPLKMTFTPVGEMEKIYKRRKTKIADGRRTGCARPASAFHPAINRRRRTGKRGSNASQQHTEDTSIRISSNIHQTQETPGLGCKGQSSPNTPQIESVESMLQDKFDRGTLLVDRLRNAEVLRSMDGQHLALAETPVQDKNRHIFPVFERESKVEVSQFPPSWAQSRSPNEQSETNPGRALPTLDQLRNSKNFDQLKARSAPRSSKRLTLPHSVAQKEVPEDDYNVNASTSVADGRRLHPSYDCHTGAAAKDSTQNHKLARSELDFKFRATHADTTKLPNGFLPEYAFQLVSQTDCNVVDGGCRSNSREHAYWLEQPNTIGERDMVDCTAAAEPSCQRSRAQFHLTRPLFTLEQQVLDEGMAKSQKDVAQGLPDDLCRTASSNITTSSKRKSSPSWTISATKPRQYSRYRHHITSLSSVRGDVATLKSSPTCAPRSEIESLGVRSAIDRVLYQQHDTIETLSRNDPNVIPPRNAIPRSPRRVVLRGVPKTRDLQRNSTTSHKVPSCTAVSEDRPAIKKETRMEPVLPGFSGFGDTFRFEPVPQGRRPNSKVASPQKALETEEMTRLNELAWRPHSPRIVHNIPAESCNTPVQTASPRAKDLPQPQLIITAKPSLSDFVTQLSPMERKLDERLGSISVYNKAAQRVRGVVAAPSPKLRSLKSLQSEGVIQASSAAFSDGQGTSPGALESTTSRHEYLYGMGSTHRQPLQAQRDIFVVSRQPFAETPQMVRRGHPMPFNQPRSSSSRPSSPIPYLSTETPADARPLRSSEALMKCFPVTHTPIRGNSSQSLLGMNRMATSGALNPSQASLIRIAHCGLAEVLQLQHVESVPGAHESGLRHGQTPGTPIAYDTEIFDVRPLAGADAFSMPCTDSLATYSGLAGSVLVTGRPGPAPHNIRAGDTPLTLKQPRRFIGRQGALSRRRDGFEPPPMDHGIIRATQKRTAVVGKFKMPNRPIFVGDFVADAGESLSSM